MMSVHAKLMQARINLQGMKLTKSGHNKFAGYQYFELGDFLPSVQNIFHELGLCGVISYEQELAALVITDIESGQSLEIHSPMSTAALKGCHEVQNLGAVQTYIRRYLWVTAMEIVEHDALDATTGSEGKGKGVIKPTDGAMESLEPEAQDKLIATADALKLAIKEDPVQAAKEYMELGFSDSDESVAFWSLLDSKERGYISNIVTILEAKDLNHLKTAFESAPKYVKECCQELKESMKADFMAAK